MLTFTVKPGEKPTDREVELGYSGSAETLAAETLCMVSALYFRLKERDGDETADWFKRLVIRGLTTYGEVLWAADDNAIRFLAAAFERDQEHTDE